MPEAARQQSLRPPVGLVLSFLILIWGILVHKVGLDFRYLFYFLGLSENGPVVDLGYAKYSGNYDWAGVDIFYGLPYAQAPLDNLRFRAPKPLDVAGLSHADEVQLADKEPEFCIQGANIFVSEEDKGGAGSEDCLRLNVYVPSNATSEDRLPVMVYFHGGGFLFGVPANFPFEHWIQQSPNVIIVSVHYRLSAFGFLSHPEFEHNTDLGDNNIGILDQREALRWVQRNIHSFGGDKDKVTINGQSAGGASVLLHLLAREGGPNGHEETLFRGAIAHSIYRFPQREAKEQKRLFDYFTAEAGCGNGNLAAQMNCLRKADAATLAQAQDKVIMSKRKFLRLGFRPVLDSNLWPSYPTKAIHSGELSKVPLIVGSTTNESLSSFFTDDPDNISSFFTRYFTRYSDEDANKILQEYPDKDYASHELRSQTATGESQFRCAGPIIAEASSKKAWLYRYNQPHPLTSFPGVEHSADNFIFFNGRESGSNGSLTITPLTSPQRSFMEELIAYWISFVRTGDPNTYKLERSPVWDDYVENRKSRIILQQQPDDELSVSGSVLELVSPQERRRCRAVASHCEKQQA